MDESIFTLFKAFEEASRKNPQKKAVLFKENDAYHSFTYQELYQQSLSVTAFLREHHINQADTVALILDNSRFWPAAFFGVVGMGAIALPLYHALDAPELKDALVSLDVKCLITTVDLTEKIKVIAHEARIPLIGIDSEELLKHFTRVSSKQHLVKDVAPGHTAMAVYTQGQSNKPKAVAITNQASLAWIQTMRQAGFVTSDDCFISLLPLCHAYPLTFNLLLPLCIGASVSFPKNDQWDEITECMRKTAVSVIAGAPELLQIFYKKLNDGVRSFSFLKKIWLRSFFSEQRRYKAYINSVLGTKLRLIVSSVANVSSDISVFFSRAGLQFLTLYGVTEISPFIAFSLSDKLPPSAVGSPAPGFEIKIAESSPGAPGEIMVKDAAGFRGYYKDEANASLAFQGDWFPTGDVGYVDEHGFLYVQGRKDEESIAPGNRRINVVELESWYRKSLYVKQICVYFSQEGKEHFLTALILPDFKYCALHGVSQIKDRIHWEIERLSQGLSDYKRIKNYTLIKDSLPETVMGNLRRFDIKHRYVLHHDFLKDETLSSSDRRLLSSPLCRKAMQYLCEKLKRKVSLDEHLELDLGLDSLERIGIFFEFQKLSGAALDEKDFFFIATVRDVLEKLHGSQISSARQSEAVSWDSITHGGSGKKMPLSFKQGFFYRLINFMAIAMVSFLMRLFLRIKVSGSENIPQKGPFILCPNHSSYLDVPLLVAAMGYRALLFTFFLGYRAYLEHPFLRWSKQLFRLIPIDPAAHVADTLTMCSYVLRNKKALCLFPEGIRSIDGEIQEFKRGIGILIKELQVDAVPVYIRGAYEAWPPYTMFPSFGKIEVVFGRPASSEALGFSKGETIDMYQNIADNLRARLICLKEGTYV